MEEQRILLTKQEVMDLVDKYDDGNLHAWKGVFGITLSPEEVDTILENGQAEIGGEMSQEINHGIMVKYAYGYYALRTDKAKMEAFLKAKELVNNESKTN